MIVGDVLDARILVEVGSRLAFGEAAHVLGIPSPTLSRRIARMEREAGVRLFERTSRRVAATDPGLAAIAHAERMLSSLDDLEGALSEANSSPRGPVRVTGMHDMGPTLLHDVVKEFLDTCEDCTVALSFSDRQLDLVGEGIDLAIRAGAPGAADLIARKLGSVRLRLHAKPHIASRVRSLEDLHNEQLALFGHGGVHPVGPEGLRHTLILPSADPASPPGTMTVAPRLLANDFAMLQMLAKARDMVVGLPTKLTEDDRAAGRLVHVLPGVCGLDIDIFAVMPSRRYMRPAVRRFLDIAVKQLSAMLREDNRDAALAPAREPA